MKSYKCLHCGLTNWITTDFCKRCKVPNPYSNQTAEHTDFSGGAMPNNNFAQPAPPFGQSPDFLTPPPPNVFGTAAGTASSGEFSRFSRTGAAGNAALPVNYQSNYSQEDALNLQKAEKEIRNAWISGVFVCVMSLAIALFISQAAVSPELIPASSVEILISVVVMAGLTFGVYLKSRVCAILLCSFYVLDKILTFAATGKFSGALLAFVFIYYLAYGIQGTFTYQKLKQKGL